MTDDWVNRTIKKMPNDGHYARNYLFSGVAVDVFKPDGSLLLMLRPWWFPAGLLKLARPALVRCVRETTRRTVAQGNADELYSVTLGYLQRRLTFTTKKMSSTDRDIIELLLRAMNRAMRDKCPDQFAFLQKAARRLPALPPTSRRPARNLLFPHTVFPNATVNYWTPRHNGRMATHRDKGNLKGGFCVMTVLRSGAYRDGLLVFPKYRVAVDLHEGDCLICDNGEAHGNTDIVGDDWERISIVCYFSATNFPS
jgi:hypothetical protein